jgi:hypothetical protein
MHISQAVRKVSHEQQHCVAITFLVVVMSLGMPQDRIRRFGFGKVVDNTKHRPAPPPQQSIHARTFLEHFEQEEGGGKNNQCKMKNKKQYFLLSLDRRGSGNIFDEPVKTSLRARTQSHSFQAQKRRTTAITHYPC